jgi:hypothetical protein
MGILARDRKYQNCRLNVTGSLPYTIRREHFPLGMKWPGVYKNNRPTYITFEETRRTLRTHRIEEGASQLAGQ